MSNPLALFPIALAAGGGRIGDVAGTPWEAQQLVAAGLTLLQRSASLVRAMAGRRSMVLLPPSPAFLTALAASDGRGAVLAAPDASAASIAALCAAAGVGAVFTTRALAERLPAQLTHVLLDDAPRSAVVITAERRQDVDLGSHHGLSVEGERDVPGRAEELVLLQGSGARRSLSHGDLLTDARSAQAALGYGVADQLLVLVPFSDPVALTVGLGAPLLAGACVSTMADFDAARAAAGLSQGVSVVVGRAEQFAAMLSAVEPGVLRLCICVGGAPAVELAERWEAATGVPLSAGGRMSGSRSDVPAR